MCSAISACTRSQPRGVIDLPRTGCLPNHCPVLPQKIFRFARRANHLYKLAPSRTRQRGVSRSSRTLGAGYGGRDNVKRRMTLIRGRRSRVVLTPRRWRQAWRDFPRKRRWQESPVHRGEREGNRQNHRAGKAGYSGAPVVTMLVCLFHFRTRDCGCQLRTRLSLRPLSFRGTVFMHHPGVIHAAGR
jgi:hypothetical protein